ncbi:MAG: acetolactate synthase small subunit [Clostridiales bacterium]|jgi:acetolactate synthase-1/3 small subunit|nr:acetolactate synthase small subunit [Clostridiales bacterium]HOA33295.1 acetolactate synthase small subunit [Clostridiales bacterium]HOL79407.1 acetolactate synthase small subunit [Clostridiales bacterium]HPP68172.1 acetolactate synthase small subunit [Clostridiales bacterium]HQA05922.1 acetolactate synthase small subunit [Clostridiales bacterium]
MRQDQFILGVIVSNHFGVLTRVSGLFSRRGYNIDSLNVSETEDPKFSRMTIIVTGDDYIKNQIVKQLSKLRDVKKVELLPADATVLREHMLIKLDIKGHSISEITEAANIFRAKVIDFNADSVTIEMTGESSKLDAFIDYAKTFGIIELCRAGALAVKRGPGALNGEYNED